MNKLSNEFYNRDAVSVAKDLLGKIIVKDVEGIMCKMKIVEVEAYMGTHDKAAHSYGGRRTARNEVMYGPCGFSYVFSIYGMYYCFNVITNKENIPQGVLIRAGEPLEGLNKMSFNRFKKSYDDLTKREKINISNGPSKLCLALNIDKKQNGINLSSDELYIEDSVEKPCIVTTSRINIDYAKEAKFYPYRFYIKNNQYVSVK